MGLNLARVQVHSLGMLWPCGALKKISLPRRNGAPTCVGGGTHGLVEARGESWRQACPPSWEACPPRQAFASQEVRVWEFPPQGISRAGAGIGTRADRKSVV